MLRAIGAGVFGNGCIYMGMQMRVGRCKGQCWDLRLIGAILGVLVLCRNFLLPSEVAAKILTNCSQFMFRTVLFVCNYWVCSTRSS